MMKTTVEIKNDSDGDDIDFDEIKQDCQNVNTEDSKMMFIYQSTEMQHISHRHGNQLILLDAAYKITKYALPLFFLSSKPMSIFKFAQ